VTMRYKGLPAYEELNKNLRVHRVWSLRSKKEICHPWEQLTYLVTGYFKCRELIRKQPYDICHTHFIIPTGVLSYVLKKQFGLEYIITSHGSDVLGYGQRFKYIYPLLVKPWKAILNNAKKIISPSNFLKTKILEAYPQFSAEKITVIPNGIDTNKFTPQKKTKTIFSSGRLLSNKGFQYLIKAVSDEDLGWEVHIAGDGPMRAELEDLAKKSKTKVVLHGWLDNNSRGYKDLIEQSSVYVLASEKENASIALLEAMSAGCAVITTNVSGCSETVGEVGLLVTVGDVKQLEMVLSTVVNNAVLIYDLQKRAQNRAKLKFEWSLVLDDYLKQL